MPETDTDAYSDAQLEAALDLLAQPQRLEAAQRLIVRRAPQLQSMLARSLESSEWFGSAHDAEVLKAAAGADPDERIRAVQTLIREETNLAMLIGVAVGFELAQILSSSQQSAEE